MILSIRFVLFITVGWSVLDNSYRKMYVCCCISNLFYNFVRKIKKQYDYGGLSKA